MLLESSIQMLKENPNNFSKFIKKVTSKGGTTEQAMRIKDNNSLFNLIEEALKLQRINQK